MHQELNVQAQRNEESLFSFLIIIEKYYECITLGTLGSARFDHVVSRHVPIQTEQLQQ